MIFIRPLLLIIPIQEIFVLNYIIMSIVFIITLIILLIKNRKLGLVFTIGLFMVAFPVVGISLLYSWTFYIMMIATIIAVFIEKKGNSGLYKLLFISGMITCFLDFLTTELITLYVPVLAVLFLRREEDKEFKFKDGFKFVVMEKGDPSQNPEFRNSGFWEGSPFSLFFPLLFFRNHLHL